jgi:hypothetical protein
MSEHCPFQSILFQHITMVNVASDITSARDQGSWQRQLPGVHPPMQGEQVPVDIETQVDIKTQDLH